MQWGVVTGMKPAVQRGVQDGPWDSRCQGLREAVRALGSGEDRVGPVPLMRVTGRSTRRSKAFVK